MLTLIHAPMSRSSRFIWLLEELDVPYKIQPVSILRMDGSGAQDPANPHPDKRVPALQHGDELLTESPAIALYLTDLYPEKGLGRAVGEAGRGAYLNWLAYTTGEMEPVVFGRAMGQKPTPRQQHYANQMDARLTAALETGPYLMGAQFTAADIMIASFFQWAPDHMPKSDGIAAWMQRLSTRPALARAMAKDKG